MSLLHRRHPDDEERAARLADAVSLNQKVVESGGRLAFLTDSLRRQNETNHFVERLQEAYGKV